MSNVGPGWYPSPDDPALQRYWDGARWTEHTQSNAAPAAQHHQQQQGQQPAQYAVQGQQAPGRPGDGRQGYAQHAGYGQPAQPPRKSRVGLIVAIVAGAAVVVLVLGVVLVANVLRTVGSIGDRAGAPGTSQPDGGLGDGPGITPPEAPEVPEAPEGGVDEGRFLSATQTYFEAIGYAGPLAEPSAMTDYVLTVCDAMDQGTGAEDFRAEVIDGSDPVENEARGYLWFAGSGVYCPEHTDEITSYITGG